MPLMKRSRAVKSRRSMKKYRVSAKRGRRVSVCGRYVNPEKCNSLLRYAKK